MIIKQRWRSVSVKYISKLRGILIVPNNNKDARIVCGICFR